MTSALPPPQLLRRREAGSGTTGRGALSSTDITACYRLLLGRDGTPDEVAANGSADAPDAAALLHRLAKAPEAMRHRIFEASTAIQREQDPGDIDLSLSEPQRAELTRHIESVWRRYGRDDAYYSVLTHPAYRADRITPREIEQFYKSGIAELDEFRGLCHRNQIAPDPAWSVLELGCGLGRVGVAFARDFRAYLGVDISSEHLALARLRFDTEGLGAARLALLSDFLRGGASCDLFYSAMVLQHNPPPIIDTLLDTCLARLNPGGYAYFQLPCHLFGYRYDTRSYLAGVGRKDEMEMHALPQHRVFALLARHGLIPIEVVPDRRIGAIGISYAFFARKASVGGSAHFAVA